MNELRKIVLEPSACDIVLCILAHRVPDRDVYVFGSRANGDARRVSDLDLAIEGTLTLRQRAELTDDFSESDLPMEVDFVELAILTPVFLKRIQQEWILFAKGHKTTEAVRVAA